MNIQDFLSKYGYATASAVIDRLAENSKDDQELVKAALKMSKDLKDALETESNR